MNPIKALIWWLFAGEHRDKSGRWTEHLWGRPTRSERLLAAFGLIRLERDSGGPGWTIVSRWWR